MVAPGWTARAVRPSSMLATKKVLQPSLVSALAIGARPKPYASALMTPAHSARPEAWLRRAQLARSAARSTVRTARADKGTGPLGRAEAGVAMSLAVTRDAPAYSARAPDRRSA